MSKFSEFLGSTAFTLTKSEEEFQWLDVILFSIVEGSFQEFESRVVSSLKSQLEAKKNNLIVSDEDTEKSVRELRYQHNLVSSDETNTWLVKRFLDVDDLYDFATRSLCSEAGNNSSSLDLEKDAIGRALLVEGFFKNDFDNFARSFATACVYSSSKSSLQPQESENLKNFLDNYAPELCSEEVFEKKSQFLASALDAYKKLAKDICADERQLAKVVEQQGLSWMQLELANLTFKEIDAAKEALLRIVCDGQDLDSLCEEVGGEKKTDLYFVDQLPPQLQAQLGSIILSAQPGGMFGPIESESSYDLIQVVSKKVPSVQNKEIKKRAESLVLQTEIDKAISLNVKWRPLAGKSFVAEEERA